MRRYLVVIWMIGATGACVSLGKPEKVAECAKDNTCVNGSPVDSGGISADAKKDTGSDSPDGQGSDTAKPEPDAILPSDDVPPINPGIDAGELPDVPSLDTPEIIVEAGGSLPEVPVVPVDGGKPDVPILPDGPADGQVPDAREANRDVAVGICAPGGVIQPAGTPCRPADGLCDIAETCDGVTADCPADKLVAAGKECRATAGDCDIAETCKGTSPDCPADGFKQAGASCRAAVPGGCDIAESCTGSSATCPVDSLAPSTTVCRASTDGNKCDPAEYCTGSSVTCPADVLYAKPAVPGTVAAAAGTQEASISWAAASGATGYNVKRSTTSGRGYTTLGSVPTTSESPYVDTGLAAATYYYVVSAIDTIATCESANSSQVSAIPTKPCTPPDLITTLTATPGNGAITLSWTAPTTAVKYTVYRMTTPGTGDYAPIAPDIVPTTTPPSYLDQAVVYGTSYTYVVTASNGTCSSDNSNAVISSPICTPPATTPTGLAATIPTLGQQVTLTWTGSADALTYQILRKLSSDTSYSQIIQVTGATHTYTDSGLINGTSYDYVLTSNNGTCASTLSAPITAVPQCSVAKPVIQTPVTVGDKEVDLTWSTPTGAVSYILSRKVSTDTTYTVLTNPPLTVTSYADKDTTLVNGTAYNYVVSASNGNCASANSNPISATPVCTPPAAPGTLTASAGDAKATLSWVASPSGASSYTVQRKTGATGTYADLFTTANGTTLSYVDTTAANDTTYYYRVRTNKGSCSSTTYSSEASATPRATCGSSATPGTPTVTMATGTQVKLDWTAANPAPSGGYNIGRSPDGIAYASIGSVATSILTFTDPAVGLTIGATYSYEITAIGDTCSNTSAAGSIALACVTPTAPATVTATNNASNGHITANWSTSTGATGYTLSRGTASAGPFTPVITQGTASFEDTPPSNGVVYYYVVNASNAGGACTSANSAAVGSAASCIIPTAPAGLSARRSGNKQVTLVWTNSSGAASYTILRSTTNGSGYAPVGTASGSPYPDITATNGTAFYYVVTASSDAGGVCHSVNSAQVAVPSCTVGGCASGTKCTLSFNNINTTAGYCWVTCDTGLAGTPNWNFGNSGTLYVNNSTPASSTPLPAYVNSGLAFYFSPSSHTDSWFGMWNGTGTACPQ